MLDLVCVRLLQWLLFHFRFPIICLQIWKPQQTRVFTRCTVLKLFTWFVLRILNIYLFYLYFFTYFVHFFLVIDNWLQVRHAQGIHNVEGEKDFSAYLSEALFDAHLTPLGWQQVLYWAIKEIQISTFLSVK